MELSVIIPFLNAAKHLPKCLHALGEQTLKEAEFILVDNGSTDSSAKIAREFISKHPDMMISLLEEKTPGASAARNRGAEETQGRWLVFTDADCIPDPDWLSDLKKNMNGNSHIGALAGCIRPVPSESIVASFLGLFTLPANREESIHTEFGLLKGGFPTANLAVRKDVFNHIGGFDDSIPIYGEDHDLCARIYKAGYSIKSLTDAIVRHNHRTDIKGMIKQSYSFGKSHALSLRRSVQGALICNVPMISFQRIQPGSRVWIDGNQADKKMLAGIIVGILWTPLWILPLGYSLYLCSFVLRHSRQTGVPVRILESPVHAGLLLLKSASMTLGRLVGSVNYRVLCI